jgi:formaldehyde-activating enzyme involved in methanogenesis
MRLTDCPVTLNGIKAPLKQWIKDSGLRSNTVINRLRRGSTPLEALTTPDREGHRLLSEVEPAHLTSPCTPIVTIGTVEKSLAEWATLAGLSSETIIRAVSGGISPLDALTKWCGPQDVFWARFWEEQMQQYEVQHAANGFVLADAEVIQSLYQSVRQDNRLDPLEFYCRLDFDGDDAAIARHYANTTVDFCTTLGGPDMKEADCGIIRLFEALRPAVIQLRDSLKAALSAVVADFVERHEYAVTVALDKQMSHYIYRALKANLSDVTAAHPEEVTVEQHCEV